MTVFGSIDIPLKITEPAGLARSGEPVRIGVPLPRGQVRDPASLRLEDSAGQAVPLQARALAHWPDGSVQWVLVDSLVSVAPHATNTLRLRNGSGVHFGHSLRVTELDAGMEIDTGAALFRIPRRGSTLVDSVSRDGSELLASAGLHIVFRDGSNRARQAHIHGARLEEHGPLRAAVVVEGVIAGTDRRRPLEFRARLVLVASSGVLEVEFRIRNPRRAQHRGGLWDLGDAGSQLIRELALVLKPATAPSAMRWSMEPGQKLQEPDHGESWTIYQDSSGGERWNSPNHAGADGEQTVSFRGYQVRGPAGVVQAAGDRATPCAEVACGGSAISCTVEGFWQNFPKALRVTDGELQAALFPAEARSPTELQGGEQKRHRMWFAFGPAGQGASEITWRQQPLQVALDPQAVEDSHAVHGFAVSSQDEDPRYLAYVHTIIEGEHSFFAGREAIDEYGWRNFGDVYADHEAVRHKGPEVFISHYNNQYDVVLGTLLQGLRDGDPRWLELARDLARHVMDIDIYHTRDDKPAYNGGLFWHSDHHLPAGLGTHRTYSKVNAKGSYGGGPDNEHNYTSGLLHYHYLTGDPEAAEAVRCLADFVIGMDDGNRTIFRFLDKGPTGNASKTVSMDYHGPGRGAGNSINALLDAFWLTRERQYLAKAEELVRRCIHPRDDIARLGMADPEYRWSYLVFLQALGKYLTLKKELGELGQEFRYARDSLLHYAAWMLEHERPFREQLHKVLLPTETWPAQDVRKARILSEAAAFNPDQKVAAELRSASRMYSSRCLADVLSFPTAHLVRPRVLLALYGSTCRINPVRVAETLPSTPAGLRKDFLGQKQRIKRLLFHGWRKLFDRKMT